MGLEECPKCGCDENESSGNDFHCAACSYIECAEDEDQDEYEEGY